MTDETSNPATASSQPSRAFAPNDVRCHFVFVPAFRTRAKNAVATSPTLSADLTAAAAECAVSWRDSKYVALRLAALREAEHLPGIGVIYFDGDAPTLPPPIRVPFEPVTLNENEPMIRGIVDSAVPSGGNAPKETSPLFRVVVRGGIPMGFLIAIFINVLTNAAVQRGPVLWWLIGAYLAMILMIILASAIAFQFGDRWFVIPGGVVRRNSLLRWIYNPIVRHTPGDTVLILRIISTGGALAELWRNRSVSRKAMTPVEWHALLGAWQSPFPAPELEQLSDLRES